ncbi:MAG: PEP-CTERM sorting domain-containing protein [Akkermansiaceae bacterium]
MKQKIIFNSILTLTLTANSIYAVDYAVSSSNLNVGTNDQVVRDNTGVVVNGTGIVSLGYFSSGFDPFSNSYEDIVRDFNILSSNDFSGGGFVGYDGFFSIDETFTDAENDLDLVNASGFSVYLFIGNDTNYGDSTYFGLIDTNEIIPDVTVPASSYSTNVNYSEGAFSSANILYGNVTNESVLSGPGISSNGTFDLVDITSAVPEPSSIALLGLTGFAFLLRRKR